jgi:hypothetical protein
VYATTYPPDPEPFNCLPFAGIAAGTDQLIMFATKDGQTFTLPDGVAQEIPANTNVRIEAHYINATADGIQGRGSVTFHGVPKASAPPYQATNFMLWGTTHISVPASAPASTGPLFQAGIPGTHFLLVTTHQHRLGTRAQVWASKQQGDMSAQIADDHDWSNPAWTVLPTGFDFDGSSGLTFQCDWMNTTNQAVTFGESALNEMCFVGGYYYPSHGLDVCLNGKCKNR